MCTEPLWCEDCGKSLQGECKLHGPLIRVKDRIIPSHARLTLPHYLTLRVLEMQAGNHQVLGVFTKKVIQKRTQFGPYVGNLSTKLTQCADGKLVLQVLKDGKKYFLNTPDEEFGNWMMFVRPARNEEEQTLVAHPYHGEVFFTTVKLIEPHTELKPYRHMDTHSPQKSHTCSCCEKTFHRKDHLKNHIQTHDPNKMAFKCEECGKKYNTKLGFKRHLALHAATSGDLTCRVCTQEFGDTEILLEHLKSHAGKQSGGVKEKKHKCDHCERQFYTRKDVRRHMVVHTGCKDFLCQFCAQRFGRKDHLTRHTKKTHSQELLKGRLQNGDFLGFLGPDSTFQVKEDASMLLSFPPRDPMQSESLSSLQGEEYSGPRFQDGQSLKSTHTLESDAFAGIMGSSGSHLNIHSIASPLPVTNSQKLPLTKYESTSFTSAPTKVHPLMLDVKGYNVNMLQDVPLHESQLPHKINLEVSMQASSGSIEDAGEYMLQKDAVAISDTVPMSSMDISHILGFWQLPFGSDQNACGDTAVPFEHDEAPHRMTFQGQPQQDLQIPMGSVSLNQLPHFTQSFSSSSSALPHFHHAFK